MIWFSHCPKGTFLQVVLQFYGIWSWELIRRLAKGAFGVDDPHQIKKYIESCIAVDTEKISMPPTAAFPTGSKADVRSLAARSFEEDERIISHSWGSSCSET